MVYAFGTQSNDDKRTVGKLAAIFAGKREKALNGGLLSPTCYIVKWLKGCFTVKSPFMPISKLVTSQ